MQRLTLLALLLVSPTLAQADEVGERIDFNRQIRPILSDKCFRCHGPDAGERKAGLRFDHRDSAIGVAESGKRAIVPSKPQESELVARIDAADESERMPPAEMKKPLTAQEKDLLKRWIAQGASMQQHWSFVAPQRPSIPAVKDATWSTNDIDRFILARLEQQGLKPNPLANKETLIRRVTLDLTGLPPTTGEVDAFLADKSPQAYERVVERLLASPHYGERLALDWLDAARFADTHGYHIDSGRDMTQWREYVIEAFNRNLPFDRFTVEQLAGDLLPDAATPEATLRQKIASGFNRNHMINFEGGAIPQEYHNAYIVDRVNTTATVWLGLTVACSQCHDHKYDPLSQKEFYQLYAFFYNVPEKGLDGAQGNAAPLLKAPTREQEERLGRLAAERASLEAMLAGPMPAVDGEQAAWEATAPAQRVTKWQMVEPSKALARGGAELKLLEDKSLLAIGANPANETYEVTLPLAKKIQLTALRLETLSDDRFPAKGPGRSENGNFVLTKVRVELLPGEESGSPRELKVAKATADFSQSGFPVASTVEGSDGGKSGWAIHPEVGKPHVAVFELAEALAAKENDQVRVTFEFHSRFAQHQFGRFRVAVTDAADPHSAQTLPAAIVELLSKPAAERDENQRAAVAKYFREHVSKIAKTLRDKLTAVQAQQTEMEKQIPAAMVMQEMDKPRETFVLMRGAYDKPGEKVTANVPAVLPPLPKDAPANRLGLAKWLVDPQHPLTARVTVNRYWQMLMGTGIVETAEDFGSQGATPTHPDLLDWLACEFREDWDVKRLIKQMVMSSAYRQAAKVSPESLAHDADNRLLSRGPRFRLPAEFIRDQALAVSGLLNRKIGGKSVSPYQPPGLWEELMSRSDNDKWTAQKYKQDHGEDLYRRTMYTFWKRTCPPPTLSTFDAPDRETCVVRRARTNTPLQALILLNDPTYVEASRKFAERILLTGGDDVRQRLVFAYRTLLSRAPSERELAVAGKLVEQQLTHYRANQAAVEKLLQVGEAPRNEKLDPAELAAWTIVASALLNLDETVTRG